MFSGLSLINDAELRQDVAATKQAAPIDSSWDLQSLRIYEEIFFRFFIANQLERHDVTRIPNILPSISYLVYPYIFSILSCISEYLVRSELPPSVA
jgi:hypothetical protein